jgi:hypothetical protein
VVQPRRSRFLRLFLVWLTVALIITAGTLWILSSQGIIAPSWSNPLAAEFGVLAVLIAFLQWTFSPGSPMQLSKDDQTWEGFVKQQESRVDAAKGTLAVRSKGPVRLNLYRGPSYRPRPTTSVQTHPYGRICVGARPHLHPGPYIVEDPQSNTYAEISIQPACVTQMKWPKNW